jgi:hypothetical protein
MPQISRQGFEQLPLRGHDFLAGVPLHDLLSSVCRATPSSSTRDEVLAIGNGAPPVHTLASRVLLTSVSSWAGSLVGIMSPH